MASLNCLAVFVLLITVNACAGDGPSNRDQSAAQAAIDRRLAEHAEILTRGDIDAALGLYTDGVVVRPANSPPLRDRAALRTFFSEWFAAMAIKEVRYTTEELTVYGDTAYQIGVYEATLQLAEQPEFTDHGSFMVMWVHGPDGLWRVHRNIFATSQAAEQSYRAR